MHEGVKILFTSLVVFILLCLAFLGFSFFVYPNLNLEIEEEGDVLPALEVLSVADRRNDYAYECPETFVTIEVPNDFYTIQSAIDSVTEGAIISVSPGIYNETIVLKPEICLVAQEFAKSEIQGFGGTVVEAASKNKIKNFKINSLGTADVGISVLNAEEVNIEMNTFENLKYGISSKNSNLSINSCAFRHVGVGIFLEDSNFFTETCPMQVVSTGLEIVSSIGDIIGMTFEGGDYGIRAKSSELFFNENNFRNQNSVGLQLCNDGDYEIGHNFFNEGVNEEILYK